MKTAIIHDWLVARRGGEKVLESIIELYPESDLFFLFGDEKILKYKVNGKVTKSFLNSIPGICKFYKYLLPLFPTAVESFDLSSYELILSSSSCVAKGVITAPNAKHICYVHSPMRYIWDREHFYFKSSVSIKRPIEVIRRILLSRLRIWDVTSAVRVDVFVANSQFVASRCKKYFGRNATVIHPPVSFVLNTKLQQRNKVLMFDTWVPYKGMLEALRHCVNAQIDILAAGSGEEFVTAQKEFAGHPLVQFFPSPSDELRNQLFQSSKVLLYPSIEDFGIIPVEAQAQGLWIVAPNSGGTAESVLSGVTGTHFATTAEMIHAVKNALTKEDHIVNDRMIQHLNSFSLKSFQTKFADLVRHVSKSTTSATPETPHEN